MLGPIVISRAVSTVPAGSVRANVVHAAPNAPRVDVYVTTPDALLAQSSPLGAFSFGETLGPVTVPSGDYRVRVTLPNDPGTVVFDSGTATLPSGGDLLVVAVENTDTRRTCSRTTTVPSRRRPRCASCTRRRARATSTSTSRPREPTSRTPRRRSRAGTKTAAIGPATITVSDGSVYTAAARDATGGGPPFGLILMDEFVS